MICCQQRRIKNQVLPKYGGFVAGNTSPHEEPLTPTLGSYTTSLWGLIDNYYNKVGTSSFGTDPTGCSPVLECVRGSSCCRQICYSLVALRALSGWFGWPWMWRATRLRFEYEQEAVKGRWMLEMCRNAVSAAREVLNFNDSLFSVYHLAYAYVIYEKISNFLLFYFSWAIARYEKISKTFY